MQTGGTISGIQAMSPQVGRDHLLDERLQTEVVVCNALRFVDSLKHTKKEVYFTGNAD